MEGGASRSPRTGVEPLSALPIVPQYRADPCGRLVADAERLAESLTRGQRDLAVEDALRKLMPERVEDGPTLHFDDLSTIARFAHIQDVSFLQDRALLRAAAGDYVASCLPALPGLQHYCEEQLGLGSVTWLWAEPRGQPEEVAAACWTHEDTRRALVRALRAGELRYVHPHMGNLPTWATSLRLRRASGAPLAVIAPPPGLTSVVNDKLWFADTVRRLFGDHAVPHTAAAYNLTGVTQLVRRLADASRFIVVKHPNSAGGAGNLVMEARQLAFHPLRRLHKRLRRALARLSWTGAGPLLVGSWETRVLSAPSVHLWIPTDADGMPIVEGVFEQVVDGAQGRFVGVRKAHLPPAVVQELVDRCWILARLLQRLGYLGRCSFDTLLVGESLDRCRVQFVECNGRWGGVSLPMTLMNRLFGNWTRRPFATHDCEVPGLKGISFVDLLDFFAQDLFDARTGTGNLVFYNPGGLSVRSAIYALGLGDSWEAADRMARVEAPRRLRELVNGLGARSSRRWARIR